MANSRFINPLFRRTDEGTQATETPSGKEASDTPTQSGAVPSPSPRPAAAVAVEREAATQSEAATALVTAAPVKFTFYFSPEQLSRLDNLWVLAKLEHRARFNKSEFVRLALNRLLDEFEREPRQVLDDLRRQRP